MMRYSIKAKGERLKAKGMLILFLLSFFSYQFSICSADSYQPMTYSAPETGFRSTSAYTVNTQRTSGFAAISASNYAALNSEDGACYSGPRKGRPKPGDYGGTGAIGNYDFHSPAGDIPWEMMVIFALILAYIKKKQYLCSKF